MNSQKKKKLLNIILWVIQALLAFVFLSAGYTKTFIPVDTLTESMPWVENADLFLVRFIGISEILGGLGLMLPSILKIKPKFTIYAAVGLLIIMILAVGLHVVRGEFDLIGFSIVFAILCGIVIWGRIFKVPIHPKK